MSKGAPGTRDPGYYTERDRKQMVLDFLHELDQDLTEIRIKQNREIIKCLKNKEETQNESQ